MIQSITFGKDIQILDNEIKLIGKNTYEDWKLMAIERPVFTPPEPKTNFIEIPGGNGILDLSEALTGYILYNNRTGSFQFRVLNVGVPWFARYSEIMECLHGRQMKIILEDEFDWYFEGRLSVTAWESGNTWSLITIDANVGPFKWSIQNSLQDWLWDPFSFETGVAIEGIFNSFVVDTTTKALWDPFRFDRDSLTDIDEWVPKTFSGQQFGFAPISPVLIVSNASNLQVKYSSSFLGTDQIVNLVNGRNEIPDFVIRGGCCWSSLIQTLYFHGKGTISIEFRRGRL